MVADKCPNGLIGPIGPIGPIGLIGLIGLIGPNGPNGLNGPPHPLLPCYSVTLLLGVWVFARNIQQKVVKILDNAY